MKNYNLRVCTSSHDTVDDKTCEQISYHTITVEKSVQLLNDIKVEASDAVIHYTADGWVVAYYKKSEDRTYMFEYSR
jgi:hypothetical protein